MKSSLLAVAALVAALFVTLFSSTPAHASVPQIAASGPVWSLNTLPETAQTVEARVDAILDRHPDATQLSSNQITWPGDGVVLTVLDENATAAGSWCGTGYACVYADANRGGYGYSFYNCSVYRLTQYGFPVNEPGGVSSWYNNQTDGATIRFQNPTKTLSHTAGVGFGNMPSYMNDRAYWLTLC